MTLPHLNSRIGYCLHWRHLLRKLGCILPRWCGIWQLAQPWQLIFIGRVGLMGGTSGCQSILNPHCMGSLERLLTGGIGLNLSRWAPMVTIFVTSSSRARPGRSFSPYISALCRSRQRSLYVRRRRHDGID
jgi:hypothetical protein